MIFIDECVTSRLEDYLKDNGFKTMIISVSRSDYRGKSDPFLLGLMKGVEALSDEDSCLITCDYNFFNTYPGNKLWYKTKAWKHIHKTLIEMGYD